MTSSPNPHDETLDFDDVTIPPVDNVADRANQDDDVTLKGPTTGEFETLPPDPTAPLESAVGTRVRYFGDYELLAEIVLRDFARVRLDLRCSTIYATPNLHCEHRRSSLVSSKRQRGRMF